MEPDGIPPAKGASYSTVHNFEYQRSTGYDRSKELNMRILLTGAAGFIGYHAAKHLLERGDEVIGLDSLNSYYDVSLKYARLRELGIEAQHMTFGTSLESSRYPAFRFVQQDVANAVGLMHLMAEYRPERVLHLAAQAGVRYSMEAPEAYVSSNLVGFANILEACRHLQVEHLAYASSSSVYGANTKLPFAENDPVDHPISLYAATKRSNELMAHTYSHLFALPTTGLRFFTVYGPWGRPDMALFLFADAITSGSPLKLFNGGDMLRDFTYVEDIVDGAVRALDIIPKGMVGTTAPSPARSAAPFALYNLGNNAPVKLTDFVAAMEQALGRKAFVESKPMQPGDLQSTFADASLAMQELGYRPSTGIHEGIAHFADWYRGTYIPLRNARTVGQ
jgi:UDP-glucuronate 4-epimerase